MEIDGFDNSNHFPPGIKRSNGKWMKMDHHYLRFSWLETSIYIGDVPASHMADYKRVIILGFIGPTASPIAALPRR